MSIGKDTHEVVDTHHEVTVINQAEKSWPAQVIDSLCNVANSIGVQSLIIIIAVIGFFAISWKMLPVVTEYISTSTKHVEIQTDLLKGTNNNLEKLNAESVERNNMQEIGLKVQQSQTKTLETVVDNQKAIITNQNTLVEAYRQSQLHQQIMDTMIQRCLVQPVNKSTSVNIGTPVPDSTAPATAPAVAPPSIPSPKKT